MPTEIIQAGPRRRVNVPIRIQASGTSSQRGSTRSATTHGGATLSHHEYRDDRRGIRGRRQPYPCPAHPLMDRDRAELWPLDPGVIFLNHGSFGACPTEVLGHQAALRAELEAEPVRFLSRELDDRLDAARQALATFV